MSKSDSEKRIIMTGGRQLKEDLDAVYGAEAPSPSGGATVVELTNADDVYTSTVKAGPLWEAAQAGPIIFVQKSDGTVVSVYSMNRAYIEDGEFYFNFGGFELSAATANDYPTSADEVV